MHSLVAARSCDHVQLIHLCPALIWRISKALEKVPQEIKVSTNIIANF